MESIDGLSFDRQDDICSRLQQWKPYWNQGKALNKDQAIMIQNAALKLAMLFFLDAYKESLFLNSDFNLGNIMLALKDDKLNIYFIDHGHCTEVPCDNHSLIHNLSNHLAQAIAVIYSETEKGKNKTKDQQIEKSRGKPISELSNDRLNLFKQNNASLLPYRKEIIELNNSKEPDIELSHSENHSREDSLDDWQTKFKNGSVTVDMAYDQIYEWLCELREQKLSANDRQVHVENGEQPTINLLEKNKCHRSNAKASDLRGGLTSEISATEKQRFINELSQ